MNPKLQGIKQGDRVRVTFEGKFAGFSSGLARFFLDGARFKSAFAPNELAADTFKIEKIEPPLAKGDIVPFENDFGVVMHGEVIEIHGHTAWLLGPKGRYYTRDVALLGRRA